jgi:hypothetical protein
MIESLVCNSGGAKGSDLTWQQECEKRKIIVNAYHFNTNLLKKQNVVILNQEQLNLADPFLIEANKRLLRKFPTWQEYVNNLLRRNYYQIKDSKAVYAIGTIDRKKNVINGGTGWAVEMARNLNLSVYVFDQDENSWFKFENENIVLVGIPKLISPFAGIGTREIKSNGIQAIKDFLNFNLCS